MRTITPQTTRAGKAANLVTHTPDGESRGVAFRVGEIFPLDPTGHMLSAPATPASASRPWGLRFLVAPAKAGKHEGKTKATSASSPDGSAPEEVGND